MGAIIKENGSGRWKLIASIAILFLCMGIILDHFVLGGLQGQQNISLDQSCIREPGFKLIDPLLLCGVSTPKETQKFMPLESKLENEIFDTLNDPSISTVSIYFRDLKTSSWTGINENLSYDPASLLKVPIMIAYYKEAETNPTILKDKIFYPVGMEANFVTLPTNQYYTAEQLIEAMIINSDNEAKDLLITHIDQNSLHEVFGDLGIPFFGNPSNARYQISAKIYALFFRILYNATYLNRTDSEKALELLSKTTFADGMVAGMPSSTIIAHKYGTYAPEDAQGNMIIAEFHDCGIIYYPTDPYLLCVMTKGSEITTLEKMIQQVSSIVYNEVANSYQ